MKKGWENLTTVSKLHLGILFIFCGDQIIIFFGQITTLFFFLPKSLMISDRRFKLIPNRLVIGANIREIVEIYNVKVCGLFQITRIMKIMTISLIVTITVKDQSWWTYIVIFTFMLMHFWLRNFENSQDFGSKV